MSAAAPPGTISTSRAIKTECASGTKRQDAAPREAKTPPGEPTSSSSNASANPNASPTRSCDISLEDTELGIATLFPERPLPNAFQHGTAQSSQSAAAGAGAGAGAGAPHDDRARNATPSSDPAAVFGRLRGNAPAPHGAPAAPSNVAMPIASPSQEQLHELLEWQLQALKNASSKDLSLESQLHELIAQEALRSSGLPTAAGAGAGAHEDLSMTPTKDDGGGRGHRPLEDADGASGNDEQLGGRESDKKVSGKTVSNARERRRRQGLNTHYKELEGLLDCSFGSRTEKVTILSGAIQKIVQLNNENDEIRKENRHTKEVMTVLKECIHKAMAMGMGLSAYNPPGLAAALSFQAAVSQQQQHLAAAAAAAAHQQPPPARPLPAHAHSMPKYAASMAAAAAAHHPHPHSLHGGRNPYASSSHIVAPAPSTSPLNLSHLSAAALGVGGFQHDMKPNVGMDDNIRGRAPPPSMSSSGVSECTPPQQPVVAPPPSPFADAAVRDTASNSPHAGVVGSDGGGQRKALEAAADATRNYVEVELSPPARMVSPPVHGGEMPAIKIPVDPRRRASGTRASGNTCSLIAPMRAATSHGVGMLTHSVAPVTPISPQHTHSPSASPSKKDCRGGRRGSNDTDASVGGGSGRGGRGDAMSDE